MADANKKVQDGRVLEEEIDVEMREESPSTAETNHPMTEAPDVFKDTADTFKHLNDASK